MRCGEDKNCLNIADDYSHKIISLNDSFNSLEKSVKNISNSFDQLKIPNDYIGNKVVDSISSLKASFNSDIDKISSCKSEALNFARSMQSKHTNHYNEWLKKQEDK